MNCNISQELAPLHNQGTAEKLCLDNLWGPVCHIPLHSHYAKEENVGPKTWTLQLGPGSP